MTVTPLIYPTPLAGKNVTEQRVMRDFATEHEDKLRYDHDRGQWLIWEDHHWHPDRRRKAFWWTLEYCYKLGTKRAERIGFATAVENGSRTIPPIATNAGDWNPSTTLVACPTGVIDLETGSLRPGKPEDMIDRALTVSPDNDAFSQPWHDFLLTMFDGDVAMVDFLQRWCGYCLSGDITENKFVFLHGTGANGKGTLLNTLQQIWGGLVATASIDVFLETQQERHPTEVARLHGAHLVLVHETREGRRWDEAKIKAMTGGDRVAARFMRRDEFEFVPRFKPMFAGNHRPHLRTVDEAIQRRLLLVPCTVTIPAAKRDPRLLEKLQAEHSHILRWAIEGFAIWQRIGLRPPDTIALATSEYLAQQDDVQLWIDEKLQPNPRAEVTAKSLFTDWKGWQEVRGGWAGSERALNEKLRDKNFKCRKTKVGVVFEGIEFSYASSP